MSLQPQQPVLVYPNSEAGQPYSHHSSDGSFGMVFVVLAVVIAVSAIACFLGRLCNRRYQTDQKPAKRNQHQPRTKEAGDIEYGFDKKIPASKTAGNGGSRGGHKPTQNGRERGEMKPTALGREPRAGAR